MGWGDPQSVKEEGGCTSVQTQEQQLGNKEEPVSLLQYMWQQALQPFKVTYKLRLKADLTVKRNLHCTEK